MTAFNPKYVKNFDKIVSLLDCPASVVGTSSETHADATTYPFQRKSFYANGRFWVFYSDGVDMVYSTSTDGLTWTSATVVRTSTANVAGYEFSVWFDGTYLHYAFASMTVSGQFYYRRGTPNADGTVTWSAVEQTITTDLEAAYPFVCVDSSGYAWIAYIKTDGYAQYSTMVTKSGNNDGTWGTTPTGFPYEFSVDADASSRMSIIPLTGGKMLAIHGKQGVTVKAKRWDGSAWGSQQATVSAIWDGFAYSAVAEGDDVHLVFLKATTYDVLHVKYSYTSDSFGSETTVQAYTTGTSGPPVLSRDPASGSLYCFWAGNPTANHIYYKKYSDGTWDASPTDWINESTEVLTSTSRLTCFYNKYGSYIGLVYMTKTSSPYNVKFDFLTIALAKTKVQTVSVSPTVSRVATFLRTQSQLISAVPTLEKSAAKTVPQLLSVVPSLLPRAVEKLTTQPVSVLPTLSRVTVFRRELTQVVSVTLTRQSKLSGISAILRVKTGTVLMAGRADTRQFRRTYLEWPITAIPSGATITDVKLKYHGKAKPSTDTVSVYSMENQPSAQPDTDTGNETVYKDVEDGTAYISGSAVFPVVGANQELDLGADAVANLQAAVNAGQTWFAIGIKTNEQTIGDFAEIYSEDYEYADPKPTLAVTYTTLSAPPYRGIYLCRMAKTKGNFLRQTLVAKVPTDLVEKITFAGKADTTPAQIEVLVHYDDYYSDTTTISLTTDWVKYAVKFSPSKNMDYITITYIGETEANKYLYFDEFTVDFHELEVAGAVDSYIQPFQEIDTTITRDASGNITKVEMANATRKVTLEITRDAQGRIISITREVT